MARGPDHRRQYPKALTVLGTMVTFMPVGVDLFWGNISVYASSYIWCVVSSEASNGAAWVLSLYDAFWTVGLMAIGPISHCLGRRYTLPSVILLLDSSLFISSLTLQYSWSLLAVSIGVFTGIGQGCLFGICFQIITEVSGDHLGLLSSLLLSALSISGAIMSYASTWYVNPQNMLPNYKLGSTIIFTQKDIIDKVPSMFLHIGAIALSLHLTGLIILQVYPSMRLFNCTHDNSSSEKTALVSKEHQSVVDDLGTNCDDLDATSCPASSKGAAKVNGYSQSKDVTPGAVLKTPAFYALWTSVCVQEIANITFFSFYKSYGQLWIHDDHFFAYLATSFLLVSPTRIAVGTAVDKLGPKYCIMCIQGFIVITGSWFFFTPILNRYVFFLATLLYGALMSSFNTASLAASAMLFGRTHATTNIGLMTSASVLADTCFLLANDAVLDHFGWFAVFAGGGGLNLVSLLLCSIFLPQRSQ